MTSGASDSTEDVSSSSLHQRHEALVLHNLHEAVHGTLVLDAAAGGHHHPPPHGVDGVRHESCSDSDSPSKEERQEHTSILAQQQRLQGVVEAEVHATVDEDAHGRDGEASVQALDAVRLKGLGRILRGLEGSLDGVLEGEVERLGREVTQHIGQVSSPEWVDSLSLQNSLGTVHNTIVWLVQTTLLDHLVLVLDEQLDSLDGGCGGLGDTSGDAGEHEVLKEPKFLVCHLKSS